MKKDFIILGSSNSNGKRNLLSSCIHELKGFSIIDLKTLNMQEFDKVLNNGIDDV